MTFDAGDMIGRYRVVRLLGSGGMGTVYEVESDDGGRRALKAFTRDHGDVEALRRRFRTEGKALQLLRHPNLMRVHELGEDAAKLTAPWIPNQRKKTHCRGTVQAVERQACRKRG